MDTRLTITFCDDDLQAKLGESVLASPLPGFGDRPGYKLMFEALNSRYSGPKTLSSLALYWKLPGFFPKLTT